MWLMLQAAVPEDFVIATGRQYAVRDFCERAFRAAGLGELRWSGEGLNEVGSLASDGRIVVSIDAKYFRPTEVESLLGDASKARQKLSWTPHFDLDALIEDMILHGCKRMGCDHERTLSPSRRE
jgi:GDPmannose 4,6-dehydratase